MLVTLRDDDQTNRSAVSGCRYSLTFPENEWLRRRRVQSAGIDELTQQVANRKWIKPRAATCALFARFQSGHGQAGRTRPRNSECGRRFAYQDSGHDHGIIHYRELCLSVVPCIQERGRCPVLRHRFNYAVTLSCFLQVIRNQAVVYRNSTRASCILWRHLNFSWESYRDTEGRLDFFLGIWLVIFEIRNYEKSCRIARYC